MEHIKTIADVVNWRMCIGCGACVYACPKDKIVLKDIEDDGLRPQMTDTDCGDCTACLDVCPGYKIDAVEAGRTTDGTDSVEAEWGPVLEVWEGHAADEPIRYSGSSAGLATILALFCMEQKEMEGVLHTGADPDDPLRNKTCFSSAREELLSRTGSRYAPASPCDGLEHIEQGSRPSVFIGKPCDVRGLRKAQHVNDTLSRNTGLAVSIFCAGTPSTKGTLNLLEKAGARKEEVKHLRYRGNGWPGNFVATFHDGEETVFTYRESWSFLQAYRPYRCHLCPEGTGDAADISCGDPWYREIGEDEKGSSLILIRTETGKQIFHEALEAGYIVASRVDPEVITRSQYNLLNRKRALWGRLLAFKIMGIPSPRFRGFHLFHNWMQSSFKDKLKSTFGTMRRIVGRKYYKEK